MLKSGLPEISALSFDTAHCLSLVPPVLELTQSSYSRTGGKQLLNQTMHDIIDSYNSLKS